MYGSGPVSGKFGKDDVTIGDLTAKQMEFGMITNVKGLGIAYALGKFDGILGLGWDSISIGKAQTWLKNIFTARSDLEQLFAFYLSGSDNVAGELLIGGIDKNHYSGELMDVPLTSES